MGDTYLCIYLFIFHSINLQGTFTDFDRLFYTQWDFVAYTCVSHLEFSYQNTIIFWKGGEVCKDYMRKHLTQIGEDINLQFVFQ